ncbi:MAG: O-antigen ligase family protein [Flavobacterium sp.]|nr:MAG: O-antigen ligase family protein [Flavobacterium sp.]
MRFLKFIILLLIFCNLPGYCLVNVNSTVGSLLSYFTFLLIIIYYVFNKKEQPPIPFLIFGLLFFFISLCVNTDNADTFFITLMKYFVILMGASVVKQITKNELFYILLLGAVSIIYEGVFLTGANGRFSGFYLNANPAGFVCILGYVFSLFMENKKLKILGQLIFTIAGFATFSRTFLLIWVVINILSLLIDFRNVYSIALGLVLFGLFLSLETKTDLNTKRVGAFSALLQGKLDDDLKKEPRTETWAVYYDKILDKPIFGNGYRTFSGEVYGNENNSYTIRNGVHNTFLMIIGEAGFFAFLLFCCIYGSFLFNGIKMFKDDPQTFLISLSLILYMLTNHNYFENFIELFVSLWLYIRIKNWKKKKSEVLQIISNPSFKIHKGLANAI